MTKKTPKKAPKKTNAPKKVTPAPKKVTPAPQTKTPPAPPPAPPKGHPAVVAAMFIEAWDGNPRRTFDAEGIKELADSIAAQGMIENLVVRASPKKRRYYLLIAGERRLRAARLLIKDGRWPKDAMVPVRVVEADDRQALLMAVVENLQRQDIPPLDEAQAFAALKKNKMTTAEIASQIGKTPRHVQLRLELVEKLAPAAKEALGKGEISLAQARVLTIAPAARQAEGVKRIKSGMINTAEDLKHSLMESVRPVAKWPLFAAALYKGPINDDPDEPGVQYFADVALAEKLQHQAIAARIAGLKKEWAWVKVLGPNEWFDNWQWAKSQDKKKAGAIVKVKRDMTLEIHAGLVEKKDAPRGTGGGKGKAAKSEPAPAVTQAHVERASRRKSWALQERLVADPMLAVKVAVLGLFGIVGVQIRGDSRPHAQSEAAPAVRQAYAELRRQLEGFAPALKGAFADAKPDDVPKFDWQIDAEPDDRVVVARAILALPDAAALKMLAGLTAGQTGTWANSPDEPDTEAAVAIAEHLKLPAIQATPEDLQGLRRPMLEALANAVDVDPGKTLAATSQAIAKAIENGPTVVLPTFAFGIDPEEKEKDLAAWIKAHAKRPENKRKAA